MHGVSGSGKSTVAQQIAKEKGAIILKADAIRKHLTNTPLTKSDAVIYDKATSDLVYLFLAQTAIAITQAGFSVVLDATFLDANKRTEVITAIQKAGVKVQILSVECTKEIAKKRIEARKNDVSDATSGILQMQLEKFVPLTTKEREITTIITNN